MTTGRGTAIAALAAVALAALSPAARAGDDDPKGAEFFETKIRPVLVNSCYECHSAQSAKVKGGLLLDTREGLRKGGSSGPAVVPGNPEASLLVRAIRHADEELKMPPKDTLSDKVVGDFVQWIRMGAPDPRTGANASGYKRMTPEEAKRFWAYQAPKKAPAPAVKDAAWPRGEIDRFILARLEEKGLRPAADADRRTLLRRLSFDLLGLPPSPEAQEAFLRDASPKAVEKLVDDLLASPHFGERWGRYWLDLARFAETNGNADNTPFPHAWRYRDYVIAAFGGDKPYDRFIREQIAGDLLPSETPAEKDELLTATGFLALTSKPRAQNNPDYAFDLIADQIDVTTRSILGLSVMCARCHDHKFDAISTKEYYGLAGIFNSTQMLAGAAGRGNNPRAGATGPLHTLSDGSNAMGVREGKAGDVQICVRGESQKKGDVAPRGVLAVATAGEPPAIDKSRSGRMELARWLTDPANPLTARVAVNRVWMHLFGRGLVESADNFGSLGDRPSHPELLDHLAGRFVEDGWSTKRIVRAVVLSRTYQLGGAHDAAAYAKDPNNVWLWRVSPRRLEAEALRDAMLAASGKLDPTPPKGSTVETAARGKRRGAYGIQETNHRSVYQTVVRGAPMAEILGIFDVANPNLVVAQREVTTVPAQALFLMNSPFVVEQSRALAQRLLAAADLDDPGRADLAYRLALSRPATEAERRRAVDFVQKTQGEISGRDKGGPAAAWAGFCQALFASAEFRYVE